MGVKFIKEDGFYPKWAQGEGRWVHQKVSIVTGTLPTFVPPEASKYLVWVPPKSKLPGFRKTKPQTEAQRASEELNQIPFVCPKCGWKGIGSEIGCIGDKPAYWLFECPECFAPVEPDLFGLDTEIIINQWERLGRPVLENPGAASNIVSAPSVNDLRNWVDSFKPMANELAYVGQQLWPNYSSFIRDARQLESYAHKNEEEFRQLVAGIVYLGSEDNKLYAIDAQTGEPRWSYKTRGSIVSTPAVANGLVYFGSWDKKLYALDALTGKLKWSYETGDCINSSPLVVNGTVFFGSWDKKLYALGAMTGKLKWVYKTGGRVLGSATVANAVIYFGSEDNNWYAIDAATGQLRWCHRTEEDLGYSTPVVAEGIVYFVDSEREICALDAASGKLKWVYTSETEYGIDQHSITVVDGIVLCSNNLTDIWGLNAITGNREGSLLKESQSESANEEFGIGIDGPYATDGDLVYVAGEDVSIRSVLFALDFPTGNVLWKYEHKDRTASFQKPSVASRLVIFATEQRLYALDALTGDYRWGYSTKNEIWTSPVIWLREPPTEFLT